MVESVLRAANILHVDELEVFRLADQYWSRQAEDLNAAFEKFLKQQHVPHWVLHFARTVIKAYEQGNFEPAEFGVYPSHEAIQFSWALIFDIPSYVPLSAEGNLLIA